MNTPVFRDAKHGSLFLSTSLHHLISPFSALINNSAFKLPSFSCQKTHKNCVSLKSPHIEKKGLIKKVFLFVVTKYLK